MDRECHILGRVVRPGPEGVPQRLLLGVLLALLLLVAVLAAALIFNYRRRKQLGELSATLPTQPVPPNHGLSKFLCPLFGGLPTPPGYRAASTSLEKLATKGCLSIVLSLNPGDLASLDRTTEAMPLPVLRSGSDYRNGLGETGAALKARAIPSAPQAPHFLSSTATPDADGLDGPDSTSQDHKVSSSDSGDGSCVPLLRTASIQLGDLDSALLAEVKDVLIPHERVVTHSDRVIGKGVGARTGGAGAQMES